MNTFLIVSFGMFAGMLFVPGPGDRQSANPSVAALHTHNEFRFKVQAPMAVAAPLFGASEERVWAPDWNPQFVQPVPPKDELGAVFKILHPGGIEATWIMTAADFAGGHVQYVYVIPEAMTTLIDIHLSEESKGVTSVHVVYERTALRPAANAHVQHFADGDARQGPEWESAITSYLARRSPHQ
ncbi:MAG TPA: hypothetical protein VK525_09610 [Candidatus Saccharimonadales bacterium]|jgi:hypothetical protein|nr:hypothetical protein [Candidatus Saccharimonadales bacterium]